jgi:hypothetical protein
MAGVENAEARRHASCAAKIGFSPTVNREFLDGRGL